MTPAAAILMLERAETSHRRSDWRLAARALGEVVAELQAAQTLQDGREGRNVHPYHPDAESGPGGTLAALALAPASEPFHPETVTEWTDAPKGGGLIAFLAAHGVRDPGGELRRADLDTWHRAKPFRRRLVRDDGALSLEGAAELAWENGFFDNVPWRVDSGRCPVTEDMLIAAIEREAQGDFRALYPQGRAA